MLFLWNIEFSIIEKLSKLANYKWNKIKYSLKDTHIEVSKTVSTFSEIFILFYFILEMNFGNLFLEIGNIISDQQ